MFWNCRSVSTSILELKKQQGADIVLLSETLCHKEERLHLDEYDIIFRLDHPGSKRKARKQGILGLKKKSLNCKIKIITTNELEQWAVIEVNSIRICFCYLEPKMNLENKEERIQKILEEMGTGPKLICGDYNVDSLRETSKRDWEKINMIMNSNDIHYHNNNIPNTYVGGRGTSKIDHLFKSNHIKIIDYRVEEGFQSSDHSAITFNIENKENRLENQKRPWKLTRIKKMNKETFKEFIEVSNKELKKSIKESTLIDLEVNLGFMDPCVNQETVDKYLINLEKIIRRTATDFIGKSTAEIKKFKDFWTIELQLAKTLIKEKRRSLNKCDNKEIKNKIKEELIKLRNEYSIKTKKRMIELKNIYWIEISNLPITDVMKLSKRARRKEDNPTNIKKSPVDIKEIEKHFKKVYYKEDNNDNEKNNQDYNWEYYPFEEEEIRMAIKRMPNSKATGPDDIPAELLKWWIDVLIHPIKTLFNSCLRMGTTPTNWKMGLMFPVKKPGKPEDEAKSYRPICLLNHLRKVFERCILNKTNKEIMNNLNKHQFGFREKRMTLDAVMTLDLCMNSNKKKKNSQISFLDVKGAYDTVDRTLLWRKVKMMIRDVKIFNCIKNLFSNNELTIVLNNEKSDRIKLNIGITQGSIMAPILYNIFMSDLEKQISKTNIGLDVEMYGKKKIGIIQYADDIVLLAQNRIGMNKLLGICNKHSIKNKYEFSVQKCANLANNKDKITINGQLLPKVKLFKYLGVMFGPNGIDSKEQSKLIKKKAEKTMNRMFKMGFLYPIKLDTKIKFFRAVLRPSWEYGINVCLKNMKFNKDVDKIIYKILCRLFKVYPRVSKHGLRTALGIESNEERRLNNGTVYLIDMLNWEKQKKRNLYTYGLST
jgi:hypothetical protein